MLIFRHILEEQASLKYCMEKVCIVDNYCRVLITFANSLDQDQARQNVRPDLNSHCFNGSLVVLMKEFFGNKVN